MDKDKPLADVTEVAEYLQLRVHAVYAGECDTHHLRKIKQGKMVRWLWAQVRRHREITLYLGKCDGECNRVFEEMEPPEPVLKLVQEKETTNERNIPGFGPGRQTQSTGGGGNGRRGRRRNVYLH